MLILHRFYFLPLSLALYFSQSQAVSAVYAKMSSITLSIKLYSTNMEDDERIMCVTIVSVKCNQLLRALLYTGCNALLR